MVCYLGRLPVFSVEVIRRGEETKMKHCSFVSKKMPAKAASQAELGAGYGIGIPLTPFVKRANEQDQSWLVGGLAGAARNVPILQKWL